MPHPLLPTREESKSINSASLSAIGTPDRIIPEWKIDEEHLNYPLKGLGVTDDYIKAIKDQKIQMLYGGVKGFYSEGVIMDDGSLVQAEVVVTATGFISEYEFLSDEIKEILKYDNNNVLLTIILYRGLIHPSLPGLSFVGNITTAAPGKFELQAEIGVRYFAGKLQIPQERLWEGVRQEESIRQYTGRYWLPYTFHAYLVECLNLLEMNIDLDFITNELKFGEGPLLTQFFFLDRPGQVDVAKQVIEELRSKYPQNPNFFR